MSGRFTRKMYDGCAIQQDSKQSTDPLELILDVNKYVNCNNICKPIEQYPSNAASLVDVESSLWGIDKLASRCDTTKHPFCGPHGCLLTNDPRIAPHITPYACERGHNGDNAVVTTNMQMPTSSGIKSPNPNICSLNNRTNNYQANGNQVNTGFNRTQFPSAAPIGGPISRQANQISRQANNQISRQANQISYPTNGQISNNISRQNLSYLSQQPQQVNALPPLRNQGVSLPIQSNAQWIGNNQSQGNNQIQGNAPGNNFLQNLLGNQQTPANNANDGNFLQNLFKRQTK